MILHPNQMNMQSEKKSARNEKELYFPKPSAVKFEALIFQGAIMVQRPF